MRMIIKLMKNVTVPKLTHFAMNYVTATGVLYKWKVS